MVLIFSIGKYKQGKPTNKIDYSVQTKKIKLAGKRKKNLLNKFNFSKARTFYADFGKVEILF